MTIIPAHIHSHEGIDSIGNNWMAQQATNNKSAMMSRIEPTILSAVMIFGKCFTLIGFDLYLKDYVDQI